VVDYNKLSLTREAVLTSLREWFDVINNDDVSFSFSLSFIFAHGPLLLLFLHFFHNIYISDPEADEDKTITTSDTSFSTLVKGVNKTKDRLAEVHNHLVDCIIIVPSSTFSLILYRRPAPPSTE
jgi:hypothetical protein